MTISEIISKNYDRLHNHCIADVAVSQSRTEEDILNDVCVTALRKFKDNDIDEEEGMQYLWRNLAMERHFQYNRKKNELLIYMECPEAFSEGIEMEDPEFPPN